MDLIARPTRLWSLMGRSRPLNADLKDLLARKLSGARAAALTGIIAAVVAAFVATGIAGQGGDVTVHNASTEVALESTTTSEAPTTTTTLAPTTTTTAEPTVVERVIVVEKKVEEVDARVRNIETQTGLSTTTTTVALPKLPPVTGFTYRLEGDMLVFSWDPVPGAIGYAIYGTGFSAPTTDVPSFATPAAPLRTARPDHSISVALTPYRTVVNHSPQTMNEDHYVNDHVVVPDVGGTSDAG
jgi:hypothetical protein